MKVAPAKFKMARLAKKPVSEQIMATKKKNKTVLNPIKSAIRVCDSYYIESHTVT